jgi:hypothetical protein
MGGSGIDEDLILYVVVRGGESMVFLHSSERSGVIL